MTNQLIACLSVPHLPSHVARHAAGLSPNRPLVVATSQADRGRVIAGCPRALAAGITLGMSVWTARDRVPGLHVALHDQAAIERAQTQILRLLQDESNTISSPSLGTWLLTLSALGSRYRQAEARAEQLHAAVEAATGWPCVLGMGNSTTTATIAAEQLQAEQAHGYTVVLPGAEQPFLDPLPVRSLPGVGDKTNQELAMMGISTVEQLRALPHEVLYRLWGRRGQALALRARGQDPGPERVAPERWRATWHFADGPCTDPITLRAVTHILSERVGRRLRAEGLAAGTLTVQMTWSDGLQRRRATSLQPRCDLDTELGHASTLAFDQLVHARRAPVAQLEVLAADLGPRQADLLTLDEPRPWHLQRALDVIKTRWGTGAILVGPLIRSPIQGRRTQPERTRA